MVATIQTVAFSGVDVLTIHTQVQTTSGLPAFTVVGLPDKAVAESRERVRAALNAMGLSLPAKRITVNLAPADLLKEGSHFDLPIALGLLVAMDIIPDEAATEFIALGELGLDGRLAPVAGVLPAAIHANGKSMGLICPADQGGEAAWAGGLEILAAPSLLALVNHFKGQGRLAPPAPAKPDDDPDHPDLADIKGQEQAKRALEIAAAGGHNLLMVGPPGSGKSMLAKRLPGLLPPMTSEEILEVSMVHSLAGQVGSGGLVKTRPYRDPHHSASVPAIVGGGHRVRPGELSLAHNGVLFLDELPEFQRPVLEALRQPLETGKTTVARANAHVSYPARVQLIGAMNPCPCGYLDEPAEACNKAPRCAQDYQAKISGPLYDRIDLHVEVPAVSPIDLARKSGGEPSAIVAERVRAARDIQRERLNKLAPGQGLRTNADLEGQLLDEAVRAEDAAIALLHEATEKMRLTARSYHRVLKVARTLADLASAGPVSRIHVGEALAYRRISPGRASRN